MKCTNCGEELRKGSDFCSCCGAPAPSAEAALESGLACGVCGCPVAYGDVYCRACGTPVLWDEEIDDPAAELPVGSGNSWDAGFGFRTDTEEGGYEGSSREDDYWEDPIEEDDPSSGRDIARLKGSLAPGGKRKSASREDYGNSRFFTRAGDL